MPNPLPGNPRNLQIAVGYSYYGNWMDGLNETDFKAAKKIIKDHADKIDPRRLIRLQQIQDNGEEEAFLGDEPTEFPGELYDALADVRNSAQAAADVAVETLLNFNAEGNAGLSAYLAADRCPGCVINVKTG
ncbi:MAG: hypothetical protein AAGG01_22100, partial [Planctomycetota bacterium]